MNMNDARPNYYAEQRPGALNLMYRRNNTVEIATNRTIAVLPEEVIAPAPPAQPERKLGLAVTEAVRVENPLAAEARDAISQAPDPEINQVLNPEDYDDENFTLAA